MIRFVTLLALALSLSFGAVHAQQSTTRNNSLRDGAQPFLSGGGDMTKVADMVELSLSKNSSGTSAISEKLCKERRACITPLELFTQIKLQHPDVGIGNDVGGLPSYLRTLVKNEHPKAGKRTVGRVVVKNGKRTMDYGYSREPAPGEVVWTDVNTGEEVLMGNCLNTIDIHSVSELVVTAERKRVGGPGASLDDCVSVVFSATQDGYVRWGVGSATGPLPPDVCNAQKQGNGAFAAWWGQCDTCVAAENVIRKILGPRAMVYQRFLYKVTEGRQELRFSRAVTEQVIYICQEDKNGQRTCGVYIRPEDWKEKKEISIPDNFWIADKGNCP